LKFGLLALPADLLLVQKESKHQKTKLKKQISTKHERVKSQTRLTKTQVSGFEFRELRFICLLLFEIWAFDPTS
tara:strand:- start:178 stop:399 length:222 start_codon:yes stop_codon:yes gene_type:complete